MQVELIAVGKLKDRDLKSLCGAYVQRSRPFIPVAVHEVSDMRALRRRISRGEGPRVVLDERGELLTTMQLSQWMADQREAGCRNLRFLLADSEGFSDEDRRQADRVLALGRLTFPHRLARLLLLEQIYRVGTVWAGHPYHHG